jgi:indole-3-glycerol phosphate synthase
VLTDAQFFQGGPDDLRRAREAAAIPALRKDFIVDAYQMYESRSLGADAVLLIVAALEAAKLKELEALAVDLGMAVLVEIHDRRELDLALELRTPLLGINNRDLRTFKTSLDTTLQLLPYIPLARTVVTESGILAREHVTRMRQAGVHAFLVGETLMRAEDPGKALQDLFQVPGFD